MVQILFLLILKKPIDYILVIHMDQHELEWDHGVHRDWDHVN
jgi:hypothetical protein